MLSTLIKQNFTKHGLRFFTTAKSTKNTKIPCEKFIADFAEYKIPKKIKILSLILYSPLIISTLGIFSFVLSYKGILFSAKLRKSNVTLTQFFTRASYNFVGFQLFFDVFLRL